MIRNAIQLLLESDADKEAFDDDVTIICNHGSYAEQWAKKYKHEIKYID